MRIYSNTTKLLVPAKWRKAAEIKRGREVWGGAD
jgi:hypothetical protein